MFKKDYRFRLVFLILVTVAAFGAVWWRLYHIQIARHEYYQRRVEIQGGRNITLHPRRGDILDRNGKILATSTECDTIVLDPRRAGGSSRALTVDLANLFGVKYATALEWFVAKEPVLMGESGKPGIGEKLEALVEEHCLANNPFSSERGETGRKYWFDPSIPLRPTPELVDALAEVLNTPRETVEKWFKAKSRKYIYRNAEASKVSAVAQLAADNKLPRRSFIFEKSSKRNYPNGRLASHILGFTVRDDTGDNIGREGIELKFDDWLKGAYQKDRVKVDAGGRKLVPINEGKIESTYGSTLVLTIDRELQMFTQRALRRRIGQVQAQSGVAVVLDVTNGEILALANVPDFDPNDFSSATDMQRLNRALTDPIEIGSVMKIVTMTLLLDRNLVSLDETIDCEGGSWAVDGRLIRDSHPLGSESVTRIFAESSNIGMAKLGLRLEPRVYYEGLWAMGLGQKAGIELPGESRGIFHPLKRWTRLSRTSLPIGYECALTPIQVISILGAIGNGGERYRPHLFKEVRAHSTGETVLAGKPESLGRVASPEACETVLDLMEEVVAEGTGEKAAVPGFRIGGKTGTTRKHTPEGEKRRYIASFAGLVPIDKPRLAIYVYIDEPGGDLFYGGSISAPVFQEIAMQAAHILDLEAEDPEAFASAYAFQFQPVPVFGEEPDAPAPENFESMAADADDPVFELIEGFGEGGYEAIDMASAGAGAVKMPSFQGQTMIEASDTMASEGVEAQMMGSGVVVRQEPAAGQWIAPGEQALLIFAHPSEKNEPGGHPALPQ